MQTVILLIGPSGSGKTSMGKRIARNKEWKHISEDDIWDKTDHVPYRYRTHKEQAIVQSLSIKQIMKWIKKGKNVVFEFLVFDNPPAPIIGYRDQLSKRNVKVIIRILRPTVNELLKRQKTRGRKREKNIKQQSKHAQHQLKCLHSSMIKKEWIVNPAGKTLEENYSKHFRPLITNQ